jgi:hypothetical protein
MTRLKVHNMAEGGTPLADIAAIFGVSVRSVQRIVAEAALTRDEVIADEQSGRAHIGRPRKADQAMIERIPLLLADEKHAHISAIEVFRRAREWGYMGARSQ